MPVQKFYLVAMGVDSVSKIDSGITTATGGFATQGIAEEPNMYSIRFEKGKYLMFTTQNEHVKFTGEWDNLDKCTVSGSPASKSINTFLGVLREHLRDLSTYDYIKQDILQRKINKDSALTVMQQDIKALNRNFTNYVKEFSDTTQSIPNAAFAANMLNPKVEGLYLKEFYSKLPTRFPNSALAKEYSKHYLPRYEKYTKAEATFTPDEKGTYKVRPADAKLATQFTLKNPDGKEISLSDYKGKYVLVDFWASWCAPCRKENPQVLAAYNLYKDYNFDILGVSLDEDAVEWVKAIKDDGLAWQQVSDLRKWGSQVVRQYEIKNIPSNVLIDPDGYIIARNLKGDQLLQKLEATLK